MIIDTAASQDSPNGTGVKVGQTEYAAAGSHGGFRARVGDAKPAAEAAPGRFHVGAEEANTYRGGAFADSASHRRQREILDGLEALLTAANLPPKVANIYIQLARDAHAAEQTVIAEKRSQRRSSKKARKRAQRARLKYLEIVPELQADEAEATADLRQALRECEDRLDRIGVRLQTIVADVDQTLTYDPENPASALAAVPSLRRTTQEAAQQAGDLEEKMRQQSQERAEEARRRREERLFREQHPEFYDQPRRVHVLEGFCGAILGPMAGGEMHVYDTASLTRWDPHVAPVMLLFAGAGVGIVVFVTASLHRLWSLAIRQWYAGNGWVIGVATAVTALFTLCEAAVLRNFVVSDPLITDPNNGAYWLGSVLFLLPAAACAATAGVQHGVRSMEQAARQEAAVDQPKTERENELEDGRMSEAPLVAAPAPVVTPPNEGRSLDVGREIQDLVTEAETLLRKRTGLIEEIARAAAPYREFCALLKDDLDYPKSLSQGELERLERIRGDAIGVWEEGKRFYFGLAEALMTGRSTTHPVQNVFPPIPPPQSPAPVKKEGLWDRIKARARELIAKLRRRWSAPSTI